MNVNLHFVGYYEGITFGCTEGGFAESDGIVIG
jgi:hypothetical protein